MGANAETARIKLRSHLFDKELIEKGDWLEEWKGRFEIWNEENIIDLQKEIALEIIKKIVVTYLGKDSVPKGRVKIERLGHTLDKLEQLLVNSKTLDNKYYRDHLNHSIRVVLLSKVLANYQPFKLSEEDVNKLILASVFHDLSYPFSQLHKIINATLKAIKRGYNIANKISDNFNTEVDFDPILIKKIFEFKSSLVIKQLKQYDHGVLSALEFLTYIKSEDKVYYKYRDVIRDIAFHSPIYDFKIGLENKNLIILILSDEIQDWGRPNNNNQISISKIHPFEISDNNIFCNFIIDDQIGFSLLRQIYAKIKNLNRLKLDEEFNITFKYPYSNHFILKGINYINDLKKLYEECMKYENIFSEDNNDYLYKSKHEAEEIYYGFNIPSNYKTELNNKLINFNQKKFLISNKNILINEFGGELLVLNEKLQIVEDIIIKKIKDEFKIQINDKVGKISGLDNKLTKDIFYELASMNRFSNAIFIKLNNPEKKYPYELGIEKYPSNKELSNIYEKLPIGRYFNKLKIITDAISSQGAFSYNEA